MKLQSPGYRKRLSKGCVSISTSPSVQSYLIPLDVNPRLLDKVNNRPKISAKCLSKQFENDDTDGFIFSPPVNAISEASKEVADYLKNVTVTVNQFEFSNPNDRMASNTVLKSQTVQTDCDNQIEAGLEDITAVKQEISILQQSLAKLKNDSMEYMLKEMRLDMKKDALLVLERMQSLAVDNSRFEKDISTLKQDRIELHSKMDNLQQSQDAYATTIKSNTKENQEVSKDVTLLQKIVSKQAQQIMLIQNKNDDKEVFSMRNNLLISGIEEDDATKTTLNQIVTGFFSQTMQIRKPITFNDAKRVGRAKPRVVQLTLTNVTDKGVIYKHSKNLKDVRNSNDESYFVNDHLPLGKQEEQRKRRDIIRRDKSLSTNDQADFSWEKGVLYINNTEYRDPITPPFIEVITSKFSTEGVVMCKGDTQKVAGCSFLGYSTEIKSLDEMKKAYVKVCRDHPQALSVTCAYRLPGTNHAQLQSYSDDREAGAGRAILNMLCSSEIYHRAIFVVRYFGNKHLGPSRFQAILAAARSAITRSSMNSVIGQHQFVSESAYQPPRGPNIAKPIRGRRNQTPRFVTPAATPAQGIQDWSTVGTPTYSQTLQYGNG